ncbi:MAG: isochorismatase family protein [Pirellulaceae bacterium]|nr:isochorismatase family protein [Pirellulaceae bacterium]
MPVVYICLGSEPPYRDLPAPLPSEKVLNKPRTGAFAGTDLHAYLQAKGVTTLFVGGTDTSACALVTGYGACDRSYQLVLVEDAALSVLPQTHEDAVGVWGLFATIQNTRRILAEYPWQGWIDRRDPTPALMRESIRKNILNLADPKEELRAFKFCTQNLLSNYSRGKISEAEFTKLWYGLDALARKYYYEALTEKMQSATFKTKFANPAR